MNKSLLALGQWFAKEQRILPWRTDPSPYRVWVSEIMLQQTQVATVVGYFDRFMAALPDVNALAQAPESEVMRLWAGLGYYSRARNLQRAAKQIVAKGEFPSDRAGWEALPGVGPYTAGAILSIALNQVEPLLDGNVERVFARLRRIERESAQYKKRLWRLSGIFVRESYCLGVDPRVANQALMELGARICTPRNPKCGICPLRELCRARRQAVVALYPQPKPRRQFEIVEESVHLIQRSDGAVLLRRRGPGEWRAGLWDLPETLDGLPLATSLGALARVGEHTSRHVVTHHKIHRTTHVHRIHRRLEHDSPLPTRGEATWMWANLNDIEARPALGSPLSRTWPVIRDTVLGASPRS